MRNLKLTRTPLLPAPMFGMVFHSLLWWGVILRAKEDGTSNSIERAPSRAVIFEQIFHTLRYEMIRAAKSCGTQNQLQREPWPAVISGMHPIARILPKIPGQLPLTTTPQRTNANATCLPTRMPRTPWLPLTSTPQRTHDNAPCLPTRTAPRTHPPQRKARMLMYTPFTHLLNVRGKRKTTVPANAYTTTELCIHKNIHSSPNLRS